MDHSYTFFALLPLIIIGYLIKTQLTLDTIRRTPSHFSIFLLFLSLLLLSSILPIRFEWLGFISFPVVITSSFFSLKEYKNNPLCAFFLLLSSFMLILRFPTFLSVYVAVAILFLMGTLLRLVSFQQDFSRSKSYLFSKLALATLLGTLGAMREYENNKFAFSLLCIFSIPLYGYIPFIFLFST